QDHKLLRPRFRSSRPADRCLLRARQSGERRSRTGCAEYEPDVWHRRDDRLEVSRNKSMTTALLNEVVASEEQFQLATYKKMPIAPERGAGVWIYTSDGDRYLDLYGGHAVAGTGHCHPHVVNAIREQAEQLLFYSNLVYSSARARAAEKLVSVAPASLTKAFFCN